MGVNDTLDQLRAAQAYAVELEAQIEKLQAVAIVLDRVEEDQPRDIDGMLYTIPWAEAIVAAVRSVRPGVVLREVQAKSLEDAARAYDLDFVSVWLHERADEIREGRDG